MKRFIKYVFLIFCFCLFIPQSYATTKYLNIEYDVPIDYSKIDKNALVSQANLLFNHFEQITDDEYKKKYIQPLLNRYSVLSVIAPDDPYNFTRLGILYDVMGNDRYAKSCFFKATNLVPNYNYACYAFGDFYYKRGAYRKAFAQYKLAENLPYPYSYNRNMRMGSIYEKLANYKDALVYYKAAYKQQNSIELYDKILLLEELNSKNMLYH